MKAKLKFNVKVWTGWVEKQPEEKILEFEVSGKQTFTPKVLEGFDNDQYVLEVEGLDSHQVKIHYKGLTVREKIGTIDLYPTSVGELNLQIGQLVNFTTPIMDGGTHITVTLIEIK